MTYTAPRTWVDGFPATAAQLNVHVRDNIIELNRKIGIFGASGVSGPGAASTTPYLLQMGSFVGTSDINGDILSIPYQNAFPGGVSVVLPINGDGTTNGGVTYSAHGIGPTAFNVRLFVAGAIAQGYQVRVNYIAIGF